GHEPECDFTRPDRAHVVFSFPCSRCRIRASEGASEARRPEGPATRGSGAHTIALGMRAARIRAMATKSVRKAHRSADKTARSDRLREYRAKRDFGVTAEPSPETPQRRAK